MASIGLANGAVVLAFLAWYIGAQATPDYIIPNIDAVAEETAALLVGDSASHTWTSMSRILISVVIAMAIGGTLVFMSSLFPVTERLVGGRILPFFNSVPALGWAILGVIWFGVGNFAVVFVITAIIVPFCMVNLWEGERNIDRELREMGRSFTRSRMKVIALVDTPLLVPYVIAAARLSFSVGWKVALIAEFFGADTGLGLVMNRARQTFDSATVFATIVVVIIIVSVVERLFFDPLSRWYARKTGTEAPATKVEA